MALSPTPLFPLGHVAATPGALAALSGYIDLAAMLVRRHSCGDGGDLDSHDAGLNAEAIRLGGARIMSVYKLFQAGTVWIITEADRSVTTLLTPDEY
jgi:hypothetical protein